MSWHQAFPHLNNDPDALEQDRHFRQSHRPAAAPSPKDVDQDTRIAALEQAFKVEPMNFETARLIAECYRAKSFDGPEALVALAKKAIEWAKRGMKLVLDFVPNHVAPDHPWSTEHPEYFIHGTTDDLERDPSSYIRTTSNIYAC